MGYEAVAGLAFQTSPLLRFSILAGYGFRDYNSSEIKDVGKALVEGGIEWLPTRRMTLSLTARREIGEVLSTDGSLLVETEVRGRLQYEIWRNLLLNAEAGVTETASTSEDRNDLTYRGSIGLEYLHTKYWAFNLSYDYLERRSNLDEFDFTRNRVRIGAKLRF